jgi:hypothetical protein
MNSETPGVVRVAGGGSLLRARLHIEQETNHYGFGTDPTPGLMSWHVEVDGNLWRHMCERVPVVFLTEGNRIRLSGEAWVAKVDRDVEAFVDKPLRFVWSSQLAGTGPLVFTALRR